MKELQERLDAKKAREVATAALANPALSQMSTPMGLGGLGGLGGMGGMASMGLPPSSTMQQSSMTNESKNDEKPRDKTKPVSSTPVPGTPWCVVWTGDDKVFFFNPTTKSSVWERPPELLGMFVQNPFFSAEPTFVICTWM